MSRRLTQAQIASLRVVARRAGYWRTTRIIEEARASDTPQPTPPARPSRAMYLRDCGCGLLSTGFSPVNGLTTRATERDGTMHRFDGIPCFVLDAPAPSSDVR